MKLEHCAAYPRCLSSGLVFLLAAIIGNLLVVSAQAQQGKLATVGHKFKVDIETQVGIDTPASFKISVFTIDGPPGADGKLQLTPVPPTAVVISPNPVPLEAGKTKCDFDLTAQENQNMEGKQLFVQVLEDSKDPAYGYTVVAVRKKHDAVAETPALKSKGKGKGKKIILAPISTPIGTGGH